MTAGGPSVMLAARFGFESEVGRGSTFYFILKAKSEAASNLSAFAS
jgi:hypothetical protein